MTAAPASIEELAERVAATAPAPLRIAGAGTKRPRDGDDTAVVDLRRLTGVVTYDPAECVLTARAGTRVADVAATLAAHQQYLPWDPPFVVAGATLGGMVAAGLNGPGRCRYGGVRDFVIGARVVDGRGRVIASGGQVVKNAAGFLTHHALVGSGGRLGVIAELSVKVFPRPAATCTLLARAPDLPAALAVFHRLRAANLDLDALELDASTGTVAARLAGEDGALPGRVTRAQQDLAIAARLARGAEEAAIWQDISTRTWAGPSVVKVPTTPSRLGAAIAALTPLGPVQVSAAGAVAYVSTAADRAAIESRLAVSDLAGAIVCGAEAGAVIGRRRADAFAIRVRRTLDPDGRFR